VKCNFNNLLKGNKPASKYNDMITDGAVEKGGSLPAAKRVYEFNQHQNSEEFKQLGTLSKENRHMDYFPVEDSAAPYSRSVVGGAKGGADLMNVIGSPREKYNYTAPQMEMEDDGNNDTLARELKKLRDIKC